MIRESYDSRISHLVLTACTKGRRLIKLNNKAIFMHGTNDMVWKDIPVPKVSDDEVLIKVDTVGISGSDVHYYQHGRIGDFVVEGDFISAMNVLMRLWR